MYRKFTYFGSVAIIYALTFGTLGIIFSASHLLGPYVDAKPMESAVIVKSPNTIQPQVSGKPTRIIIPSYGIDLVIDPGRYDVKTKQWTLSDNRAHHADITPIANNHAGATFIYGHGTNAVFGKIGTNPPALGTTVEVQTDNGRSFTYTLSQIQNLTPEDTDIFSKSKQGTPRLVVQTCTGAFSEWRTMFTFELKDVR